MKDDYCRDFRRRIAEQGLAWLMDDDAGLQHALECELCAEVLETLAPTDPGAEAEVDSRGFVRRSRRRSGRWTSLLVAAAALVLAIGSSWTLLAPGRSAQIKGRHRSGVEGLAEAAAPHMAGRGGSGRIGLGALGESSGTVVRVLPAALWMRSVVRPRWLAFSFRRSNGCESVPRCPRHAGGDVRHTMIAGSSRALKLPYDRDLYKARSEVERTINLLKQARRFATRYEKTLRNYSTPSARAFCVPSQAGA